MCDVSDKFVCILDGVCICFFIEMYAPIAHVKNGAQKPLLLYTGTAATALCLGNIQT